MNWNFPRPAGAASRKVESAWRPQPRWWGAMLLMALVALALPGERTARAQGPEAAPRFYVLSVQGDRVFVDLGRKDGVSEQQVLQVYRTGVTFDHPVTGGKLVGTTYLGDIKIVEVSDVFSIAEVSAGLADQIKPGYEVRFRPQDAQAVLAARERLRDLMEDLASESESWQNRVRREMSRYHNNNNRISAYTELVRFSKDDNYVRAQTDFTYRLFRIIYAVRFGIGGINGMGFVPDAVSNPSNVAFYYGYSSMELRVAPFLSLSPVFQLGLNNNGVGYGFGGAVRIGPELGTNLEISGSAANLVGSQLALSYNHFINERLMLSGKVAWENYVTGDVSQPSVRVLLGAHYELTNRVQFDLNAGLGGRNVRAIGPSVMLGLTFNFPTSLWWMQELEGK